MGVLIFDRPPPPAPPTKGGELLGTGWRFVPSRTSSLRRKSESSFLAVFRTPAFAGVKALPTFWDTRSNPA